MLLTVNVSNTTILLGGFEEKILVFSSSVHTDAKKSSDEYAVQIISVLNLHGYNKSEISGVIMSCVVPSLAGTIKEALEFLYDGKIFVVGPGLKTGLNIRAENPSELGSSIVCQAVATLDEFKAPCIIISMCTALSIFAVDKSGALIGGAILPGIALSAKALRENTAQLPHIDLSAPIKSVVGSTSTSCMQSGLIFGTACAIDGMIDRFKQVIGEDAVCVATGEITQNILKLCKEDIYHREDLVHKGLRIIHERNAR